MEFSLNSSDDFGPFGPPPAQSSTKLMHSDDTDSTESMTALLGYYEIICLNRLYASKFPSSKTTPPSTPPLVGCNLFHPMTVMNFDVLKFMQFLVAHDFGLYDQLLWLFLPNADAIGQIDQYQIINHLLTLRIHEVCETTVNHTRIKVTSDELRSILRTPDSDQQPCIEMFLHFQTAPQEALDLRLLFVDKVNSPVAASGCTKLYTTVGHKKKSPTTVVHCLERYANLGREQCSVIIDVLQIGLYGAIIGAGEHIERTESDEIWRIIREQSYELSTRGYIPIKKSSGINQMLLRATKEEITADEIPISSSSFIVGVADEEGRDPRYAQHEYDGITYGYYRPSMCVLIVTVYEGTLSLFLLPPTDVAEVSETVRIIALDDVINEFREGGSLLPAFPAHPREFLYCIDRMLQCFPDLFQ
jgi:hypothetical protein